MRVLLWTWVRKDARRHDRALVSACIQLRLTPSDHRRQGDASFRHALQYRATLMQLRKQCVRSCPVGWCNWRWVTAITGMGRIGHPCECRQVDGWIIAQWRDGFQRRASSAGARLQPPHDRGSHRSRSRLPPPSVCSEEISRNAA
jgi:hypothetical protein